MQKIKTIAMYLPQYHRTKENDEWWGEGFTEWTAVKSAEPFFEGHMQPEEPLGGNYYNLLDKKTMQWQANLAKEYQVYGFCFYHYWFKEGRRILEKPAENLLKWKDVDMKFCFSWANVTWAKTWSRIQSKSVWADKFEKDMDKKDLDNGILLEQKYGGKKEWKEHFEYLLPFFQDERYIKINGQPLFVIHVPQDVSCLNEMINYWQELAALNGILPPYFVGTNFQGVLPECLNANLLMSIFVNRLAEQRQISDKQSIATIGYEEYYRGMLSEDISKQKTFIAGYPNYDDTPRQGLKGTILIGSNPFKFYRCFRALVHKSIEAGNEFVFINAWNEWGEGMHLEPDTNHEFRYLEAVCEVMKECEEKIDVVKHIDQTSNEGEADYQKEIHRVQSQLCMKQEYSKLVGQWLMLKEEHIELKTYLCSKGYFTIAIYGMGELGFHLLKELQDSTVSVIYGIDRRAQEINGGIPIYHIQEELPKVDVVIVTVLVEYEEVKSMLMKKVPYDVISLKEVIMES